MTGEQPMTAVLTQHHSLCHEILALAERENRLLRDAESSATFEVVQERKSLLDRLNASLLSLKDLRHKINAGANVPAETRKLAQQVQELIMRILVLDRENEQFLLRRGLIPARHVPPAARQKPHFVAELYRRQTV